MTDLKFLDKKTNETILWFSRGSGDNPYFEIDKGPDYMVAYIDKDDTVQLVNALLKQLDIKKRVGVKETQVVYELVDL